VDFTNLDIQDLNKEKTTPGTLVSSKHFTEEYLASLRAVPGALVYDRMRRSDYEVQRILRALYTPILSAEFKYVPVDPASQDQVKQALFKQRIWQKWMRNSWNNTLYEILSYLPFGFAVFEPYFHAVTDADFGQVLTIASLGYMSQKSIYEWDLDKYGLKRIRQYISTLGTTIDKYIDANNLLIFTNQREGDNYEGISILRAAYGNYIRKELYLKLDMIGNEKMAIGVPVIYVPDSVLSDSSQLRLLDSILASYCAHESAYIRLPERFKDGGFEIKKGEYDSKAIDTAIKREDAKMADSILASFLNIGTERAGGNAQNEGHMGLFLKALMHNAKYIFSKLDDLAHYVYVLNFGEPDVRLDTTIKGITQEDALRTMEIIRGYTAANLIMPDDKLEARIRQDINLPDMDIKTRRDPKQDNQSRYDKRSDTDKSQSKPQDNPKESVK
jgi:hypothetical protein